MGRKVSDEYTVPLCSMHHRLLHQTGNEIAWWEYQQIDPLTAAAELWRQSRQGSTGRPIQFQLRSRAEAVEACDPP